MKRIKLLTFLLVPLTMNFAGQAAAQGPAETAFGQASPTDSVVSTMATPVATPVVDGGEPLHFITDSHAGWFGDIGFYVLNPQWGSNPAYRITESTGVGPLAVSEQVEFDHDADFVPVFSAGYSGAKGLGVRARFWNLNNSDIVSDQSDGGALGFLFSTPSLLGAGSFFFAAPGPGTDFGAAARHELDMDVIDLEGIWETSLGRTSLLFSSGVRYAHLGQEYQAGISTIDTTTNIVTELATFHAGHTFNGAGPTASLQAYRSIGDTNLSLYSLGRGSVLFGEQRQHAGSTGLVVVPGISSSSITNDSVMPVVELEVGGNWTRGMGNFDLFVEGGFVGQAWFNAGNAANSDSLSSNSGILVPIGGSMGSDNANHTMGLVGFKFSTGVRF